MNKKEFVPVGIGLLSMFILSASLNVNFFLSLIISFVLYQRSKREMIKKEQKQYMLEKEKERLKKEKEEMEKLENFNKIFKNSDELMLMNKAYEDLSTINRVYKKTDDREVKSLLKTVFQSAYSMFKHLKENPNKINRSRKFFDHHLETAKKVAKTYEMFMDNNISESKKEAVRENTIKALESLDIIMKKFLESLFQNEFLDIESDIRVLESLKKENY